jgi:hypothetical protein
MSIVGEFIGKCFRNSPTVMCWQKSLDLCDSLKEQCEQFNALCLESKLHLLNGYCAQNKLSLKLGNYESSSKNLLNKDKLIQ